VFSLVIFLYQPEYKIENTFFNSPSLNKLLDDEITKINESITLEELEKTMTLFGNGKSPGNDGLDYEFYKLFWMKIRNPLKQCYDYSLANGELSTSQRQAVITLLDKRDKDRMFLKNWRPISLLNFDYKLLSKTLSMRMQVILPKLIHPSQAGFVKDRFIGDSIRVLQDLMDYTVQKNIPGMLLLIDFEKAFDTLEWNFIWKTLEKFNFGESFIRWIKILYNRPESCIMNNGNAGRYFEMKRGLRQGDPLSPYIFILAIELLAQKIRDDKNISGIKVQDTDIKLALYADDITVVIKDKESGERLFSILIEFAKCSGLKINMDKTEGLWLGRNRFSKETPFGIKWPVIPIKVLGIYLSYNSKEAIKLNFDNKIEKLVKQLHWWKARNLTLTGRILIVKALGLSKFSLLASLVNVPKDYIIKVNTLIYEFVWKGKTDKVKRKIINQNYSDGGLKMLDFNHMIMSAKIKWIKRYLNGQDIDWKILFESFCKKKNLGLFLRSNFSIDELTKSLPLYYMDSLKYWHSVKVNKGKDLENTVWYNRDVKIGNHTIFSENLFQCGVWTVYDLYNNEELVPFKTWLNRGVKQNDYLIWRGLVKLFPKQGLNFHKKQFHNIGLIKINSNQKFISIDIATEKQIKEAIRFQELLSIKAEEFKACRRFESIHGDISQNQWKNIYSIPRLCGVDNFNKDIQYKILFRFLPTNKLLYKMRKVPSPTCVFCSTYIDSLEHMLYECYIVRNFWFAVALIWNMQNDTIFTPTLANVTFGVHWNEDANIVCALNYIILYGKQFIFEAKIKECYLCIHTFKTFLKDKCTSLQLKDPSAETLTRIVESM